MRDVDLMQLWLDPSARQPSQRVVAIGVLEVKGLEPELIWLAGTDFASGQQLVRLVGNTLEVIPADPTPLLREGDLD